jgi:hypothetical protein
MTRPFSRRWWFSLILAFVIANARVWSHTPIRLCLADVLPRRLLASGSNRIGLGCSAGPCLPICAVMTMASRLTAGEAHGYLRRHGLAVKSQNVGYLRRIVGNLQAQEAAGVPFSLEAARGHAVTPEHPTRRRPRLPAPAIQYTDPRRSKYWRMTQPIGNHPSLGQPITVRVPHVHRYMGRPAPGMVLDAPNRKILITRSHERVRAFLRQLERSNPHWRVGFDVYDCETMRQSSIFRSPRGHRSPGSEGMGVSHLLDEAANQGYSIEEFLIRAELDYYNPRSPLSHICEYVIYAHLPGA